MIRKHQPPMTSTLESCLSAADSALGVARHANHKAHLRKEVVAVEERCLAVVLVQAKDIDS